MGLHCTISRSTNEPIAYTEFTPVIAISISQVSYTPPHTASEKSLHQLFQLIFKHTQHSRYVSMHIRRDGQVETINSETGFEILVFSVSVASQDRGCGQTHKSQTKSPTLSTHSPRPSFEDQVAD